MRTKSENNLYRIYECDKKTKKFITQLIYQQQNVFSKVYPGLTCFQEGLGSIPVDNIPGLKDTDYKPSNRVTRGQQLEESQNFDTLTKLLTIVLDAVNEFLMWKYN